MVKLCTDKTISLRQIENNVFVDHQIVIFCCTSQLKYLSVRRQSAKCRGSILTNSLGGTKLTNFLGKQQLELSTRMWSGWAPWSRGKFVSQTASSKRFVRSFFYIYFWVGRYNKTLNDWSRKKTVSFVSLRPQWGSRGNKTHCFPWVIKCLLNKPQSNTVNVLDLNLFRVFYLPRYTKK